MKRDIIAGADLDELDAVNWARAFLVKLVFAYPEVDMEKLKREAHAILHCYPDAPSINEIRTAMRNAS